MTSKQEQPNMGHRHSLTIETNPLHLLPSNIRRFSQADTMCHPAAPILSKLKKNPPPLPESEDNKLPAEITPIKNNNNNNST